MHSTVSCIVWLVSVVGFARGARFRHSSARVSHVSPEASGASSLAAPVLVDFYIFTSKTDGTIERPEASTNIAGDDRINGFYQRCKGICRTRSVFAESCNCTHPVMDFCDCIAKLLIKDLNTDFGSLDDGAPGFALGTFSEVDVDQRLVHIKDGHKVLHELMTANESAPYHRKSGRITVWVAKHIEGSSENTYLGGTTYLDQPLYQGMPGAAVLMNAGEARANHLLSHEMGHVVGFHHVAGPEQNYVYRGCPDGPVTWKMVSKPSCEPNIMGSWYDGPYCCPWPNDEASSSNSSSSTCLANSQDSPKSPFCCGDQCTWKCSKDRPAATFATKEHKPLLKRIYACWHGLKGKEAPAHRRMALLGLDLHGPDAVWECQDFLGTSAANVEGPLGPPCVPGR